MTPDIEATPCITVVVPAFNASATLPDQLRRLRDQRIDRDVEVIIADNGSTDGTREIVRSVMGDWPHLSLISASDVRGAAHARNVGVGAARAQVVAFCDADDLVEEGWLAALVAPVEPGTIVAGKLRATQINDTATLTSRPRTAHDVDTASDGRRPDFAPSGNMAMYRDDYLWLGGMDESFRRSHDVEFSYRARQRGMTIVAAPDAVIDYRYRPSAATLASQAFRGGRVSARLRKMYPAYTTGRTPAQALQTTWWLITRLPYVLVPARRRLWIGNGSRAAGRLVGSLQHRVWYL